MPASIRSGVQRFLCALAILTLTLVTAAAQETPANDRDQQLQQIEKRIDALDKAVQELKAAGGMANVAPRATPAATLEPIKLDPQWLQTLPWRSIGPANMGGRVTDFAVVDSDPSTFWVATAGGGLLKTTNNGTTFVHQFDHENTVAIGSVCVAQSDPKIVWVGTGENNPRNSVSYGDGVYKSTNGGVTWQHMGLTNSFQIGRIAIDRKNPNIVYVGALGRLYGPNEERGVYKTVNGGETWERMLYLDDKTGIVDMQMHPTDSSTLLVAAWERQRDGLDSHPGNPPMADGYDSYDPTVKWGPLGGIYKTTDAGKKWHKLTNGLPTSSTGRIGIDYYRKDPKEIFAIVDCEKIGMGPPRSTNIVDVDITGVDVEGGIKLTSLTRTNGASAKAGLEENDIIKTVDGKPATEFLELQDDIQTRRIGDQLKYKIQRGDKTLELAVTLERQPAPTAGAYLGLTVETAENGLKVTAVADGSPAAEAGIKENDIVTMVGDKSITSDQLTQELNTHSAGDKLKLKIANDDQKQDLEVTLAALPQGFGRGGGGRGGGGRGGGGGGGGGSTDRPYGANLGGQAENVQNQQGTNGWEYGGIYKSTNGGESWTRINSYNPRPMYFSLLKVDPTDDRFLYAGGVNFARSTNYGRTFRTDAGGTGNAVHADQHALWIDPRDGRHMIVGCDGGFYATYDRTANWDHLNLMDMGQFYSVDISLRKPYWVAGGLQDNGSWFGPSRSLSGGGPINEDWLNVGGGDGFVCRVDPNDPDVVYSESQDGATQWRNLRTGETGNVRPTAPRGGGGGGFGRGGGRGGGGANVASNEEATGATNAAAGGRGGRGGGGGGGARGGAAYRFNWNTCYILSSHNSRIVYTAGNYVFRSLDRGTNLQIISPEITLTSHGSGTAIAESPLNADVLYAGTDDGALWVTRDGGHNWSNIWQNVGLPGPRWVSSIEPSRYAAGRAYVVFDCHRSNEDDPCIYVTENFGQTWKSLRANLPMGSSRVVREDIVNPNLLFLGTEFGAWCSLDRGQYWNKFGTNFPTVCVMEFAFYPANATPHNGDVVAATHGRSLWVLDATVLRQIKPDYVTETPALYQPADYVRWRGEPARGTTTRKYVGQNPPGSPQIYYSLAKKADTVSAKIVDITGATVNQFSAQQVSKNPGLHLLQWGGGGGARGGRGGGGGGGGPVAAGGEGTGSAPTNAFSSLYTITNATPVAIQVATGRTDEGFGGPTNGVAGGRGNRGGQRGRGGGRGGGAGGANAAGGGNGAVANAGGGGGGGFGGGRGGRGGPAPGTYRVVLTVDGQEFARTITVEADPIQPTAITAEELRAQEAAAEEEEDLQESGMENDSEPAIREIDPDHEK